MMQFKRIFAVLALVVGIAAPVAAQESDELDYKPFPHVFIGIQGGIQSTVTSYDFAKIITPTASLSIGAWFSPVIGARISANGIWNEGGLRATGSMPSDKKYKYDYLTADIDLMVNIVNIIGHKKYYPWNLYAIGGIGLNTAWHNGDALALKSELPSAWSGKQFSHNLRFGLQLDYNICKNVSVNLEVDANNLRDKYNSKLNNHDDWQLTAQLGLAFKFGYKKPAAPVPVVWATRIDTTWYDDVEYRDVTRDRDIKREIFFLIRESDVEDTDAQIKAVAEFLQGVREAEITISAYADEGTGNPKINMMYSELRAKKTEQALIDNGVDPSIIKSVQWFGDTVQPYPDDNDKNRVSIITGHGIYTDKDAETVRKFRTEEVEYQVE